MLAEDWRKIGGEWAEDWREKFPPYPLEVFPPLRGVEKTSGREAGERKRDTPLPSLEVAGAGVCLPQVAVPCSHILHLCPTTGEGSATQ